MNSALTPFVDATPTPEELLPLGFETIAAIRQAADRVERAAWAEEGKRVARGGDDELRIAREREMLPQSLRAGVLSGNLNFRRVRSRSVMQCRDWALKIRDACIEVQSGQFQRERWIRELRGPAKQ